MKTRKEFEEAYNALCKEYCFAIQPQIVLEVISFEHKQEPTDDTVEAVETPSETSPEAPTEAIEVEVVETPTE